MMVVGESVSRRACTETPSTCTLAVRVGPYRGQFKSGNDAKLEESVAKPSGTQRQGQSDIECYTCGVLATCPETVQKTVELVQKKSVGSQREICQTDWGLKWQLW